MEATLIATVELAVAGFAPKVPVIPGGQFEAVKVTPELNPLPALIVTVELPLAPACTPTADAARVKLGAPAPTTEKVPSCCQLPDL